MWLATGSWMLSCMHVGTRQLVLSYKDDWRLP